MIVVQHQHAVAYPGDVAGGVECLDKRILTVNDHRRKTIENFQVHPLQAAWSPRSIDGHLAREDGNRAEVAVDPSTYRNSIDPVPLRTPAERISLAVLFCTDLTLHSIDTNSRD